MRHVLGLSLVALCGALACAPATSGDHPARPPGADAPPEPTRPVHTFSIVARDAKTGEMGVAVASHAYAAGSLVCWAEAGVGVVATQAQVDPRYGARGLALMRSGLSAPDALKGLLAADARAGVRQVAMLDQNGKLAAHTGDKCIGWAGHVVGTDYSVQANIMVDDQVVPAIARAFETSKGDLAERLLAALAAGEAAGGDLRGRQSAALVVVEGKPSADEGAMNHKFDVRIDDHPEPIPEVRRQLRIQRALHASDAGEALLEKKQWKAAVKQFEAAVALYPENPELGFWCGIALVQKGQLELALPFFRRAFAANHQLTELARRLLAGGTIPDQATLDRILAQAQ